MRVRLIFGEQSWKCWKNTWVFAVSQIVFDILLVVCATSVFCCFILHFCGVHCLVRFVCAYMNASCRLYDLRASMSCVCVFGRFYNVIHLFCGGYATHAGVLYHCVAHLLIVKQAVSKTLVLVSQQQEDREQSLRSTGCRTFRVSICCI